MVTMGEFEGFSMPEGSYLPPEFRRLVVDISTIGELKTLLVLLDACSQPGLDAHSLTAGEVRKATGLSKQSVYNGLERGVARGTVVSQSVDGVAHYRPTVATVGASLNFRPDMHESYNMADSLPSTKHVDEHASVSKKLLDLDQQKTMVEEFGVHPRVAADLVSKHSPDYLGQHIAFARYALKVKIARSAPGYLVASIRDGWSAPRGYGEGGGKRWYTDEEYEQFFEHEQPGREAGQDESGTGEPLPSL